MLPSATATVRQKYTHMLPSSTARTQGEEGQQCRLNKMEGNKCRRKEGRREEGRGR
jgi:hypothetical protein